MHWVIGSGALVQCCLEALIHFYLLFYINIFLQYKFKIQNSKSVKAGFYKKHGRPEGKPVFSTPVYYFINSTTTA